MSPLDPFIRRLSQLDRASPQFSDRLATLLEEEKNLNHVSSLSAEEISWLAEYLDNVSTSYT